MIDWRHWHNEPLLVGGLIFIGWLYAILTGPLRSRLAPGEAYPRTKAWWFYSGLVVFYLAVGSPLDQIGESFLLSAHMIQHELIIYVSAACVLVGTPHWAIAPMTDRPMLRTIFRVLFHPVSCALIYSIVTSVWHAPGLYDLALRQKTIHVVEHLMFFAVALLYWWPILSPSRAFPPRGYGAQMLYLLSVTVAMTPVFAFIAFSDNVLYPTYEYAPRLIDKLDPGSDQLLGAVLMKGGGIVVTLVGIIVAFYRWYQQTERPDKGVPIPERSFPRHV